jgi:hypothetical protein
LAKDFDSLAATMRLAVQTGAVTNPEAFAATFGVSRHAIDAMIVGAETEPEAAPLPASQVMAWSGKDRRIFISAVATATATGALIIFI